MWNVEQWLDYLRKHAGSVQAAELCNSMNKGLSIQHAAWNTSHLMVAFGRRVMELGEQAARVA